MSKSNSGPCPYPDETCEPSCRQCIERFKAKPTTCEWKWREDNTGWDTKCNVLAGKYDHPSYPGDYKHCPFCGGVIKEIE